MSWMVGERRGDYFPSWKHSVLIGHLVEGARAQCGFGARAACYRDVKPILLLVTWLTQTCSKLKKKFLHAAHPAALFAVSLYSPGFLCYEKMLCRRLKKKKRLLKLILKAWSDHSPGLTGLSAEPVFFWCCTSTLCLGVIVSAPSFWIWEKRWAHLLRS